MLDGFIPTAILGFFILPLSSILCPPSNLHATAELSSTTRSAHSIDLPYQHHSSSDVFPPTLHLNTVRSPTRPLPPSQPNPLLRIPDPLKLFLWVDDVPCQHTDSFLLVGKFVIGPPNRLLPTDASSYLPLTPSAASLLFSTHLLRFVDVSNWLDVGTVLPGQRIETCFR